MITKEIDPLSIWQVSFFLLKESKNIINKKEKKIHWLVTVKENSCPLKICSVKIFRLFSCNCCFLLLVWIVFFSRSAGSLSFKELLSLIQRGIRVKSIEASLQRCRNRDEKGNTKKEKEKSQTKANSQSSTATKATFAKYNISPCILQHNNILI